MIRENLKWQTHKRESTEAGNRGGMTYSSEEASVMEVERRGAYCLAVQIEQLATGRSNRYSKAVQTKPESNALARGNLRATPSPMRTMARDTTSERSNKKSRMSREVPVRFREGVKVRFLCATRLSIGH